CDRRNSRRRPEIREVDVEGVGVASDENAKHHQGEERQRFCRSEDILDESPKPQPARIYDSQKYDDCDRDQLLRRNADSIALREDDWWDNPARRRDGIGEHSEKPSKRDRDRGNCSGLDHEEQRPAIKKSPERTIGFAQIYVLTAGARHHRSELAVTERGN